MRRNHLRAAIAASIIGLSLGAIVAPTSAVAAPAKSGDKAADAQARELFRKGDAAYAEGRYEEAYARFREAYELSGRPQLLFNISNALERLGRHAEAFDALEKYLASGKARDRDVIEKRLENLRKRVEEQQWAEEQERRNQAKRRAREQREAEEREDNRPRVLTPEATGPTSFGRRERPVRVVPIVLLGTGIAALATSAVFGGLTLSARSEAESGCKDGPSGRLCSADARSALERDETFGLVTDIALASGAVIGGLGLYLLLTAVDDRPYIEIGAGSSQRRGLTDQRAREGRARTAPLQIEARPAGAGVEVVGRF